MRSSTVNWSLPALLLAGSLGCATAQKPSSSAAPATAAGAVPAATSSTTPRAPDASVTGLLFAVDPAAAEISIDGAPRGAVADLADRNGLLPLAPGIYQVSLKAPGFVTWRAEVALGARIESIKVNLVRKP